MTTIAQPVQAVILSDLARVAQQLEELDRDLARLSRRVESDINWHRSMADIGIQRCNERIAMADEIIADHTLHLATVPSLERHLVLGGIKPTDIPLSYLA